MPQPKVYRLSFDFSSAEAMKDFWESFQHANQCEPGEDWFTTELVHKDCLHDQGKKIHNFLVRERDKNFGNGRPVEYDMTQPREIIRIKGITEVQSDEDDNDGSYHGSSE
mgnify:CR=1 FL=1